ncbi:MAG: ABC transporter permease [Bryobacteraceae bacterium]
MRALRNLIGGIKALFCRRQASLQMDEELRGYLEAATASKMHSGMSEAEAMRASRVEAGSLEAIKQEVRSAGWESTVESFWHDVRYGMRQLLRSPGFSAVAILTLAVGIGANTAIFTLVHAVILQQLPIASPQQLYRIGDGEQFCCEWGGLQGSWGIFDYAFYEHVRDTNPSFGQIAAFSGNIPSFNVRRADSPQAARTTSAEYVSGNYFSTLGLQPHLGRLLSPADDRPDAQPMAVMGYRTWQQQYAADPSMIGCPLLVNGMPFTLAGIAPPGFFGDRLTSDPPELWIPLNQQPAFEEQKQNALLHSSGMAWLYLIGRLKPGVAPANVQKQLSAELRQWLRSQGRVEDGGNKIDDQHIRLMPAGSGISQFRRDSKYGLYLLSAASLLVLLIACANLANLLLSRAASRQQQTALRLSLGATRSRLIRTVLTESVLLSLLGGAAGVLLAYAVSHAILMLAFRGVQYVPISASPSLFVLGFALLLSTVTGIIFGAAPAWIGTQPEPSQRLRSSNRSTTSRSSMPQKALIVVQAALSILLLAVAGLVTQSLRNLEHTDFGFQARGRLLGEISFEAAGYKPAQLTTLYQQIQTSLESIPGVLSASLSRSSPQNLCCVNLGISISGRSEKWIEDVNVVFDRVSPHYFKTIGTPLAQGRAIAGRDTQSSPHVAVVDQAFVRRFFPRENPIGKRFGLSLPGHANDFEIVGVARDAKYRNPAAAQDPMVFLPFTQTTEYAPAGYRRLESAMQYAYAIQLNVTGEPDRYQNSLRGALAKINPNLSLIEVRSYSEQVAVQFNEERLIARLTGLFSMLALLLASVGLYGVTTYNVTRRTSEIGIRMALGANRRSVLSMVLRTAFLQVAIGLFTGIPLAIICGRYLSHQLYGVGSFEPLTLGAAVAVLCSCSLLAAFVPARRAASLEPLVALRTE